MFIVVEFRNEKTVGVIADSWLDPIEPNLTMWPTSDTLRNRLLARQERPPADTQLYPIRVLGRYETLQEARRRARVAEDTSDLSSSEPTRMGKGYRRKIPRRLTSESEEEISDVENIPPRTPTPPTKSFAGWPTMTQVHSAYTSPTLAPAPVPAPATTTMPRTEDSRRTTLEARMSTVECEHRSMTSRIDSLESLMRQEFALLRHLVEKMRKENSDFRPIYQHNSDWNRKREETKSADRSFILTKLEQIEAATSDTRRTLVGGEAATGSRLPVCTDEALRLFLRRFQKEETLLQDSVNYNLTVGGRSPKEIIRHILSQLLGPPLCTTFTWQGSTQKDKKSFIGSTLFTIFTETTWRHPGLHNVPQDVIRKTTIEWFHGSRDRYGGIREKRREAAADNAGTSHLLSDDTEPALLPSTSYASLEH